MLTQINNKIYIYQVNSDSFKVNKLVILVLQRL